MNLISKNFFLNSIISIQDTFNTASCYVLHKPIRRTQFRQIGLQSIIFLTAITLKSTAQNESCLYIYPYVIPKTQSATISRKQHSRIQVIFPNDIPQCAKKLRLHKLRLVVHIETGRCRIAYKLYILYSFIYLPTQQYVGWCVSCPVDAHQRIPLYTSRLCDGCSGIIVKTTNLMGTHRVQEMQYALRATQIAVDLRSQNRKSTCSRGNGISKWQYVYAFS